MDLVQDLITQAQDSKISNYKRRDALETILKNHRSEPAVKGFLTQCMHEEDEGFKREIVDKLSRYAYPHAAELIRPLIKISQDDYLVRDSLILLSELGSKDDLELIRPLVDHDSFTINYAARQAFNGLEKRLSEEPNEALSKAGELDEPHSDLEKSPEINEVEKDETVKSPVEAIVEAQDPERIQIQEPHDELEDQLPSVEVPESLHTNSIFDKHANAEIVQDTLQVQEAPSFSLIGDASQSKNLRLFMGDLSDATIVHYQGYYSQIAALPQHSLNRQRTQRQLNLIKADREDDLEELSQDIKKLQPEVSKIKNDLVQLKKQIRIHSQEQEGLWTNLLNNLSQSRQDGKNAELKKLENRLGRKKKSLTKLLDELESKKNEQKAIQEPIEAIQKSLSQLTHLCEQTEQSIQEHDWAINDLIVGRLIESPADELATKLAFLSSILDNATLCRITIQEIQKLSRRLQSLYKVEVSLTEDFELQKVQADEKMKSLGEEVCASFHVTRSKEKFSSKVSANIYFEEENSFWGGYSNASGSAHGSGTVKGTLSFNETTWKESEYLRGELEAYLKSFANLGNSSARMEWNSVDILNTESSLHHFVDTLRMAMEADFHEVEA